MSNMCERCHESEKIHKERFCKACRKEVIRELETVNYFSKPDQKPPSEQKWRKLNRPVDWHRNQINEDDYGEDSQP